MRQHLPVVNPFTCATLPKLVTGRFEPIIAPQLIDGKRIAREWIRRAPFQVLI